MGPGRLGHETGRGEAVTGESTRRVIVNADDMGLSHAVNLGIIAGHQAGSITSASLLMNMPATGDALALTAGTELDVGVHLNLTVGRPMAENVPTLVNAGGRFSGVRFLLRRLAQGRLSLDEVEREWATQIEAFLASGRRLWHLDTHLHLHALPPLSVVICRLAQRFDVPVVRLSGHGLIVRQVLPLLPARVARRWCLPRLATRAVLMPDQMVVLTAMGPRYPLRSVRSLLRDLPMGVTELVTHPGYVDDELIRHDTLRWERERELSLLRSPWWREDLAAAGARPITFRELAETAAPGEITTQRPCDLPKPLLERQQQAG